MGVAIKCIVEEDFGGIPYMEGKSLALAYCGDMARPNDSKAEPAENVVALDFGRANPPRSDEGEIEGRLFTGLDPFIKGDYGFQWHTASEGLTAVRVILEELRDGAATVSAPPDLEMFGDDDDELKDGVICDLEVLEQILVAAEKAGTRFYLAIAV